jgi:hypothetical protein
VGAKLDAHRPENKTEAKPGEKKMSSRSGLSRYLTLFACLPQHKSSWGKEVASNPPQEKDLPAKDPKLLIELEKVKTPVQGHIP